MEREKETERERERERETERETHRKGERERQRQTDRQTDRQTETDRQTDRDIFCLKERGRGSACHKLRARERWLDRHALTLWTNVDTNTDTANSIPFNTMLRPRTECAS